MCYSVMIKQSVNAYGARMQISSRTQAVEEQLEMQVYPHGGFPVVTQKAERKIEMMRYSLVPRWSKVEKPKFATYNARIESMPEKPTWAKPLTENRCLVAFNGFFESCYEGTHEGQVVRFFAPEEKLLVAAGVYETWVNKESGELIDSFAIITTEPNEFIKQTGHDRSPLFLPDSTWESWLEPRERTATDWQQYLQESHTTPELQVEAVRPLKACKKK